MSELNNPETSPKKMEGRKILLILAAIFVLPFTLAAILHLLNLHPSGHSYGNLIQPPQALSFPVLHDTQAKAFTREQWLKKWSIVMVVANDCDTPCQESLHMLKQVNVLLNKDAHRLQRVLLVGTQAKSKSMATLQIQNPDLLILAAADAEISTFGQAFNVPGAQAYLVDPFGNLMMTYPEKMDPKGLFSDLKRLIKNTMAG
jgi:cytochrome oxidase Cu insertion factor (SCO1/SenC/PrrC family)